MAGIDSSIYFQQQQPTLPNPLAQAAQLSQLQGGMAQNALAQTKLAQAQRQDQQEQASNAAYSNAYDPVTGKIDPNKVYASLSSNGNGGAILPAQKQFAEQAKAAREQEKATLDAAIQKQGVIAQTAAAAKDQASWDSGLQSLTQMGIDTSNVPKVYDPATADMLLKRSLTGAQQLEQVWKQKGYDQDAQKIAETGRHNKVTEATAQGTLGVAQGNLALNRQKADADANGVDSGISADAITNAASRYNIDGTLPATGMGKSGAAARAAILNKAAELAGASGVSADDQRIAQIGNKANSAALSKLQQQQTMVGAFEKNFNKNADIALSLSDSVDRTGIPLVNKWVNAGKRSIGGDPDLAAFDASVKATVNEYAKIVSGSMGNTASSEGEIKKISDLLNSAQTPQQVKSVLNLMKRETQNRMQGFEDEKTQLRSSMTGNKNDVHKPVINGTNAGAKPSLNDIFGK